MVINILVSNRPGTAGIGAGSDAVVVPARVPRRSVFALPNPLDLLARWWAGRRQQDEIARLTDALRADIGLPPRPPSQLEELRFIAIPDRAGVPERLDRLQRG